MENGLFSCTIQILPLLSLKIVRVFYQKKTGTYILLMQYGVRMLSRILHKYNLLMIFLISIKVRHILVMHIRSYTAQLSSKIRYLSLLLIHALLILMASLLRKEALILLKFYSKLVGTP